MTKRFVYLYMTGGIIAIGLFIFDLTTTSFAKMTTMERVLDIAPILMFLYLSYKSYHEKKDKELM